MHIKIEPKNAAWIINPTPFVSAARSHKNEAANKIRINNFLNNQPNPRTKLFQDVERNS